LVPRVVKLDLSHCKSLTSAGISELAKAIKSKKHLTELNISWVPGLSDESLIDLAAACPSLTHLTMRGSIFNKYFSLFFL
jgi:hypothetical protein